MKITGEQINTLQSIAGGYDGLVTLSQSDKKAKLRTLRVQVGKLNYKIKPNGDRSAPIPPEPQSLKAVEEISKD